MRRLFLYTFIGILLIAGIYVVFAQLLGVSSENANEGADQDTADNMTQNEQASTDGTFMTVEDLNEKIDNLPADVSEELLEGGPPPEGIPAIDHPHFIEAEEAGQWLEPNEPVIWVEVEGEARAYPLQILMWHEIVNDTIQDIPVTVTFCPLCNSSFSFKREMNEQILDFGTTGYLHQGSLLMYDRQTHSLWAHFGGEALGGELAGNYLDILPSSIVSWNEFTETFPEGLVLSRETSFDRNYGQNPYVGYDEADEPPFLFSGEIDGTYAPKERIVAIEVKGQAKAYLTDSVARNVVLNDTELDEPVVLFFQEGTASGLDSADLAAGKEVGSTNVFFSEVDGEVLDFYHDGERIKDEQTDSVWNFFGEAISGPLEGEKLTAVPFKLDTFWFAWAAYEPDTLIHQE